MTVFVRFCTEPIEDDTSPVSPTLAMLCGRMSALNIDSLIIDRSTFCAAEAEMLSIFKSRGYSDVARAQLPQRNFLLFGCPVVCED